MKLGLFGGTFNPIHRCHLIVARQVQERLGLDSILFIPSGVPPHKPADVLAPAAHRLAMVREAIIDQPGFAVSDIEIRRATTSYSIDTVRALQEERGPSAELFFVIGLDAFLEISTWKQAPDLLRACHFVVIGRPGSVFSRLNSIDLLPSMPSERLHALDAGVEERADIALDAARTLVLLSLPPCPISASAIRDRIRRGVPCDDWLPLRVHSYIMRVGLYKEASDRA